MKGRLFIEGGKTSKGIFWFPCFVGTEGELIFTEDIEALPVPCDEDGNPQVPVSFNSRNGRSNTHKDSWKTVTAGRKDLRGIPWNYFPRGRVEISHGRAFIFMNPEILNCANYLERIREKFGIGHLDIQVRIEKLLALSESTNESEAMSAARTARKLMLKYHISVAEGEKTGGESPLSSLRVSIKELRFKRTPMRQHHLMLAFFLAKNFRCKTFHQYGEIPCVKFIGFEEDAFAAFTLLQYRE